MKKLKFKTVLILLLLALVIGGCENLLDFTFKTDYSTVNFIVDPEEAGNYVESYVILNTNIDSIISEEGQNLADLESVKINEVTVEVVGEGNFDPVGSIEITIEAEGLDAITIASKSSIPDGLANTSLDVYEGELKNYLEAPDYILTLTILLDEDLVNSLHIKAKIKYEITVGT